MNLHRPAATTMTSREFNQDTAKAKRAAKKGPVLITTRGEPTHVLVTKEEYDRMKQRQEERSGGKPKNLAEALAHPESAHLDFDPPKLSGFSLKVPDFE